MIRPPVPGPPLAEALGASAILTLDLDSDPADWPFYLGAAVVVVVGWLIVSWVLDRRDGR